MGLLLTDCVRSQRHEAPQADRLRATQLKSSNIRLAAAADVLRGAERLLFRTDQDGGEDVHRLREPAHRAAGA